MKKVSNCYCVGIRLPNEENSRSSFIPALTILMGSYKKTRSLIWAQNPVNFTIILDIFHAGLSDSTKASADFRSFTKYTGMLCVWNMQLCIVREHLCKNKCRPRRDSNWRCPRSLMTAIAPLMWVSQFENVCCRGT